MTSFRDFGWYDLPDGRRKLLTWWCDGVVTLDGPGGVEFLGLIDTLERAQEVFAPSADYAPTVEWVRERMRAAACPDCGGRRRIGFADPFQRGGHLEATCPTCAPVPR